MLPHPESNYDELSCTGVQHSSTEPNDFSDYVQHDLAPVVHVELGGRAAIVVEGADGERLVVADHGMTGVEIDAIRRAAPFLPAHDLGFPEV